MAPTEGRVSNQGSICRGGCGGSTPAGERLQKCSRGRILTPAVNYGDKRSMSRWQILPVLRSVRWLFCTSSQLWLLRFYF